MYQLQEWEEKNSEVIKSCAALVIPYLLQILWTASSMGHVHKITCRP